MNYKRNQRTVMLNLEITTDAPVSFLRSRIARVATEKALKRAYKGYGLAVNQNISAQVAQPSKAKTTKTKT